jgi:putative endonuclease
LIRSFKTTTTARGAAAEDRALAYLLRQGLALVVRNYRCKGGEIDLVMRAADGTLAFVEVRQRSGRAFGGAAASVTPAKQRRVLRAAEHYLGTLDHTPPCRLEPGHLAWLPNAFDQNTGSDDGASWAAS